MKVRHAVLSAKNFNFPISVMMEASHMAEYRE